MNHEEIRDLAAMYALGGLDGDDRVRFESLLRSGDLNATAALKEFESSLVSLATESAEAPPPSVKAALMSRIADEAGRQPSPTAVVTPLRPRRVFWPVVWAAALAAGIAAITVGLSVSSNYEKRLQALTDEAATLKADIDRERAFIALLRDPSTEVLALAGLKPAPEARARMFWNQRAGGYFVAAGLPVPPSGKTYQLWAIAGKNAPVSAGVFGVDAKGTGGLRVPQLAGVGKVDTFAVTLEPAGGLPAPSGEMYLAGNS
jgi:anti-sigma-K factor RskA